MKLTARKFGRHPRKTPSAKYDSVLSAIELPSGINTRALPNDVVRSLAEMRSRIERFQDCWQQHHAAQFVAADYELVYQTLDWINESVLVSGKRFLEWGSGFATVSCLASRLGWNAFGVESHQDLFQQGQQTVRTWEATVQLHHGNFLPGDAESLAFDPTLPSLGHGGTSCYASWELQLDDFDLVYSYPWPGEDEFHEDVFDRFCRRRRSVTDVHWPERNAAVSQGSVVNKVR